MCGIIGYNSQNDGMELVIKGLKSLEYRGYDSCGISCFVNHKLKTFKSIGRIESLEKMIKLDSNKIIAHTRWATHGKADLTNSHPISSFSKRFVIVHNGIIENYLKIKKDILKDYQFETDTDTEVIANIIEYFSKLYPFDIALRKTYQMLEGSFACLIIDQFDEEKIWFMKNKSPLLIGKTNGNIIASDILAFPKDTTKYCRLKDGDVGYITKNDIKIYNEDNSLNECEFIPYQNIVNNVELGTFHHYMEKEIHEQPTIIDQYQSIYFKKNQIQFDKNLLKLLGSVKRIYLVASGTSYHSALVGAYYFNAITKIESYAFIASEFTIKKHIYEKESLFIVISQSGETADVIKALTKIKKESLPTLAITNVLNSTIASMVDFVIDIKAGIEIAVASTKAYTASTSILYLLASANTNLIDSKFELDKAKTAMQNSFNLASKIRKLSVAIAPKNDLFYLGKGLDYLLAMEASLKLKEISYIHCESFASGELKHGTIALISEGTIVIAIITQEKEQIAIRSSIEEVKARGAKVITIVRKGLALDTDDIIIDDTLEYLTFLPVSVIFQLFAYFVALERETDIDKPRNLAKSVTVE